MAKEMEEEKKRMGWWPEAAGEPGVLVGGTGAIALDPNDLTDIALQTPGVITATGTNEPERDVNLAIGEDNQYMGVYAFGETIVEIREHHEDLPEEDVKVGQVGFADGVAFIRTKHGWVNLGDALTHAMPNPHDTNNDRRGAIEATKKKRAARNEAEAAEKV